MAWDYTLCNRMYQSSQLEIHFLTSCYLHQLNLDNTNFYKYLQQENAKKNNKDNKTSEANTKKGAHGRLHSKS